MMSVLVAGGVLGVAILILGAYLTGWDDGAAATEARQGKQKGPSHW